MKTLIEQHQQWCIHYERKPGMPDREACKKGIVYDDLTRVAELGRTGCMLRLPCIRSHQDEKERKGQPFCECPHMQFPTMEESIAHESEVNAHMEKMAVAFEVVGKWRVKPKPQADRRDVLECPICKGRLHVRQSSYNGHVHAKCETQGCVSWME